MKTFRIISPATGFDAALKHAAEIADKQLGDNMPLSWYDRERNLESPAHASECHEGCAIKGFWDYALNRGGALAVELTMAASYSASAHWQISPRPVKPDSLLEKLLWLPSAAFFNSLTSGNNKPQLTNPIRAPAWPISCGYRGLPY